jgi:hypothetical protein
MKKTAVAEQLSLFGLKPTARMRTQPAGQVMLDVLEITEPPKEFIRHEKHR